MSRFGAFSKVEINQNTKESVPLNIVNTQSSIWRQFEAFCCERKYELDRTRNIKQLANILQNWAFNMKNVKGDNTRKVW
mgnify:CR=1 FL=1